MIDPACHASLGFTTRDELRRLALELRGAASVSLLIDYDATLVPLALMPALARPDPELAALLTGLSTARFDIHIVSGRDRHTLESWLGALPVTIWAEHAFWLWTPGANRWQAVVQPDQTWIDGVRLSMLRATLTAAGSFVEDKGTSLAWHYRLCAQKATEASADGLRRELAASFPNVDVLEGHKVIEARAKGVHKGLAVISVRRMRPTAVVVAIGDDETDEDMFKALSEPGVAIHVGTRPSLATYLVSGCPEVRQFLQCLGGVESARQRPSDVRLDTFQGFDRNG
jgi:trehalose 6-phosphate synthase/phosphatase